MASVNQVTLIGYLADDPKKIPTKNNQSMCTFSIGTTEKGYTTQQGVQYPDRTEWHSVTCFGKLAEICLKFLHKGSQVYIQGKLRTRKYNDQKTNTDRYVTEIEADTMQMLDRASQNAAPAPQMQTGGYTPQYGQAPVAIPSQGRNNDDLPF